MHPDADLAYFYASWIHPVLVLCVWYGVPCDYMNTYMVGNIKMMILQDFPLKQVWVNASYSIFQP